MQHSHQPDLSKIHRTAAYRAVTRSWEAPVVVACSGGIDSSALVVLATAAHARGYLPDFLVTYVDHRSRSDSAADADHIGRLCRSLGAPFQSIAIEADSPPPGESTEAWWREQRYLALHQVVNTNHLTGVATAHTRDDQIESILMRLLAGMGGSAAGMTSESSVTTPLGALHVFRPLLEVSRIELEEVLKLAGVEPLIDPSNADSRYLRNRIRLELIPMLDQHIPGFRSPLLRAAELAQRDSEVADAIANTTFADLVRLDRHAATIDRDLLAKLPASIGARIVRMSVQAVVGEFDREMSFERTEAVRLAAKGRTGAIIELPGGVTAKVTHQEIVISRGKRGGDV